MDLATPSVISIENGKTDLLENGNIEKVARHEITKNDQNEVANDEKPDLSENTENHILDEEKRESHECEVEKSEQQSKKRPHEASENNKEVSDNYDQSRDERKRARRVSENEATSKCVEKSNEITQRRNSEEQIGASEEDDEHKDDGESSKKKRVRRNSDRTMTAAQNSESDEPRQLRKRQPQTPSNSKSELRLFHFVFTSVYVFYLSYKKGLLNGITGLIFVSFETIHKTETLAKAKVEKRDKRIAMVESISKNPKKNDSEMKSSKKKKTVGHRKQDAYDFDDDNTEEISSMPPLKHVHVDRGNFMEMKFTRAPTEEIETVLK
uniref:Uncharacterized protein n=1 Tax=Romanomermis culicivorax TaxID=13658 RepID=A0A915KPK4_ROMCU